MSDNMLPMRNASGQPFALLFEPGHRQHGWIFYKHADGQWVTLRPAFAHELARAKSIRDIEAAMAGIPCRA